MTDAAAGPHCRRRAARGRAAAAAARAVPRASQLVGTASDGESAVQHGRGADARPAAARHRHAGARRDRRRARLAARSPSPAVMFVTAFDQFAVAAFEVAAVDYLMKPVEPARLAARARPRPRLSSTSARRAPAARREPPRPSRGILGVGPDRPGPDRRPRHRPGLGRARLYAAPRRPAQLADPPFDGRARGGLDPELFVRLHRSAIVRKDYIAGFSRNPSGRWIARLVGRERTARRPPLLRQGAGDRRRVRLRPAAGLGRGRPPGASHWNEELALKRAEGLPEQRRPRPPARQSRSSDP